MPRTVSWGNVMFDQSEDSVVVRLLSAGLDLATDTVVHRSVSRDQVIQCRRRTGVCVRG